MKRLIGKSDKTIYEIAQFVNNNNNNKNGLQTSLNLVCGLQIYLDKNYDKLSTNAFMKYEQNYAKDKFINQLESILK